MPLAPSDLHTGADVFSSDGHKLGELHRLVLKRSDLRLTYIVVDIGFLRSGHKLWEGGLGLEYDRIVPVEAIASATDDRIELTLSAASFKDMPEYTTEYYEEPQDLTPDDFDIPDIINRVQALNAAIGSTSPNWIIEKLNKPLDAVDVKDGMSVWRLEPHEKIGDVEGGLFDEATGRLRALIVKRGFLLHRDVVLPARYIVEVIDNIDVRVDVSDAELDQLREHKG